MTGDDAIAVLREIRDAVRTTNERVDRVGNEVRTTRIELSEQLDQTNSRIDQTNERLDQTNERLDQTNGRLDQTNERLDQTNGRLGAVEAALVDLAEQQRFVVRWLRAGTERDRGLERKVDDLERRVDDLESDR